VKAKIVNLSLGGQDTPEIDPLEDAVNRLTDDTGTLFVVSAGNNGPGDSTVGSPGSADAALTVGNVDKQDRLNPSSSRGPRVGDGAIKPDVTAPGTSIVAAKSKDSTIGVPFGDKYLELTGTSMAAPHVAGAAALLLQEHPSWTAGELKGALRGSAKVAADQTAFQQGAGRIDLAKAIKQTVIAEPGSVSFGIASYPHQDDPTVAKDVTFRNLGNHSVTLTLGAAFDGPDGTPAPAGALTLSASTLTVPAGGTATVQAVSDTRHAGPDGFYTGRITATAEGTEVVVPAGVNREGEAYDLRAEVIGPDGKPGTDFFDVTLVGLDHGQFESKSDPSGTVTWRLPKGEYLLDSYLEVTTPDDDFLGYKLVAPSVQLTGDQTIVLDARKAKVVNAAAPRAGADLLNSSVGFDRHSADGRQGYMTALVNFRFGKMYTLDVGPRLPAEQLTGHVTSHWGQRGEDGSPANSPFVYGLSDYQPGYYVTGYERTAKPTDFATVDRTVNATTEQPTQMSVEAKMPGVAATFVPSVPFDTPTTMHYFLDRAALGWLSRLDEADPITQEGRWNLIGGPVQYLPGKIYRERWNAAVFVPGIRWLLRNGGDMNILIPNHMDADGHRGGIQSDSASSVLYRNGAQVASSADFGFVEASGLPKERAAYKFVTSGTQTVYGLSTRTDLTVTFNSAETDTWTALPAHTLRFLPEVDSHNDTVGRTHMTALTIVPDGTPGLRPEAVKSLAVQISGDDGKTWRRVTVTRSALGYKAIFATPDGATLSLKAHLVDAAGNTTDQTVMDAYLLN
jgi:hypothetical protein